MKIIKGTTKPSALRIVIYGIHGSAKTTLAAKLRNALFLDYEGGTHGIECDKVESADLPRSYATFKGCIESFKKDHQGYETLVIDTTDALENAFDKSYSASKDIESIFSVNDYGRTVNDHNSQFAAILDSISELVETGMNVVWICHEQKRKIEPLEGPKVPNDHSELKLSKGASKLLMQSVDWAIFCARKTFHVESDKRTGEKAHLEGGKLWTFHTPSNDWDAKHRACINVPEDCSMDKLQDTIQQIIDKSIKSKEELAQHENMVEQTNKSIQEFKAKKQAGEQAKAESPKTEAPKTELEKLLIQYGADEKKFRAYAVSKMGDRYGNAVNFETDPIASWPKDAIEWFVNGIHIIAQKVK